MFEIGKVYKFTYEYGAIHLYEEQLFDSARDAEVFFTERPLSTIKSGNVFTVVDSKNVLDHIKVSYNVAKILFNNKIYTIFHNIKSDTRYEKYLISLENFENK